MDVELHKLQGDGAMEKIMVSYLLGLSPFPVYDGYIEEDERTE